MLLLLLASCVQDAPLPFLGDCAQYPGGVYEYGQIGIGTCLAGPTELAFLEEDDGTWTLLVTNANPYQLFTGGSLLALPWENLDLGFGRNIVTDLDPAAVSLPDFAGGLALADATALVGVRLSEDARTRVSDDQVHLVDLADPAEPAPSDRGEEGGSTITVQSDPVDVVYDPATGLAFAANRTDHSISVIDARGDTLSIVLPWPEHSLTAAAFADADGSGSTADLVALDADESELLTDDTWTFSWVEGTWRLWRAGEAGGLTRWTTTGDGAYEESALGAELEPDDLGVEEIRDPFYAAGALALMLFAESGAIGAVYTGGSLAEWDDDVSTYLVPEDGEDALGGPSLLIEQEVYRLFFDVQAGGSSSIHVASSEDNASYQREGAVLVPAHDHESGGLRQPFVFYDSQSLLWRMYYSASDGERWTIGHATSPDLITWTADDAPAFELPGEDAAAPVISAEVGRYRMWYSRGAAGAWTVGYAESPDGYTWTEVAVEGDLFAEAIASDAPPRLALQAAPTAAFRVEGQEAGYQAGLAEPGDVFASIAFGWSATALAGWWLGTSDAGGDSAAGIRLDSVDEAAGLAWLTLEDDGGTPRIGLAYVQDDGSLLAEEGPIFEPGEEYDEDGVSSPVVWADAGGYWMAYGAHRNGRISIALARSDDGLSWEREGEVLEPGDEWDSHSVVPTSIQALDGGGWRLWYSGSDGETWRVGSATISEDGADWTRDGEEPAFPAGTPGEWDDSGVRDAWVVAGDGGDHLWYSGFDGDNWRIGYAFRPDDAADWIRAEDPLTEAARPVLEPRDGLFYPSGLRRPVVTAADQGWAAWFTGLHDESERVGRALGREPDRLYVLARQPTLGDTLTFETRKGDDQAAAIPLDTTVEGFSLYGVGLTALDLDSERGLLYASSKLSPYIFAIDVRDDSVSGGFQDLNYLDVEAVIVVETASNVTSSGFRQVLPAGDTLYALNDNPESVYLFDATVIADDAYGDIVYSSHIGWLPAPTSNRDAGVDNTTYNPVGPSQMVLHPDGLLLVTNFNANSITVYDLALGPYGQLIAEIPLVGENPYAIALTPDAKYAVFANYSGEVAESGLVESTLGVLDLDPASPTWLQVLTWVANR